MPTRGGIAPRGTAICADDVLFPLLLDVVVLIVVLIVLIVVVIVLLIVLIVFLMVLLGLIVLAFLVFGNDVTIGVGNLLIGYNTTSSTLDIVIKHRS